MGESRMRENGDRGLKRGEDAKRNENENENREE